jgi:hypothetical protein
MNSINDLYLKRQGQSPTACPQQPERCSTCGMLECLCRPRFFAGQILQADDLNRLDAYIRGKNRLHNRQLHGWGVVNGLEVTCNPCGDGVAVGCGYALSPCGDDIVVCDAVSVDICALIKRCKDAERQWQACTPFQHATPQNCDAGEEEWILAIRYAEAPARGVKPLRPTPDCTGNGSCGCGGGCGGQCNCGGTPGAASGSSKKPRGAPVQCEPTVICEGFAFEVYRKPPEQTSDATGRNKRSGSLNPDSELYKRFECCMTLLVAEMPKLPGQSDDTQNSLQAWTKWSVAARAQLRRYLQTHGSYNCELIEQFNAIPFPASDNRDNSGGLFLVIAMLVAVWFDAVLSCFCSALLPPCPAPTNEVRVPLASVHIAGHPCRVKRICNWTVHRKIAITTPALGYWLSLLPLEAAARKLLERLCCVDLGALLRPSDRSRTDNASVRASVRPSMFAAADQEAGNANDDDSDKDAQAIYEQLNELVRMDADQPQRIRGATEMVLNAFKHVDKPLEFSTLIEGLLSSATGQGRNETMLSSETANLPQFLLLNQLMRPLAGAALGRDKATPVADQAQADVRPQQAVHDEMASMRAEIDALHKSVKAQAAEIERMKHASAPSPAPASKPKRGKP